MPDITERPSQHQLISITAEIPSLAKPHGTYKAWPEAQHGHTDTPPPPRQTQMPQRRSSHTAPTYRSLSAACHAVCSHRSAVAAARPLWTWLRSAGPRRCGTASQHWPACTKQGPRETQLCPEGLSDCIPLGPRCPAQQIPRAHDAEEPGRALTSLQSLSQAVSSPHPPDLTRTSKASCKHCHSGIGTSYTCPDEDKRAVAMTKRTTAQGHGRTEHTAACCTDAGVTATCSQGR